MNGKYFPLLSIQRWSTMRAYLRARFPRELYIFPKVENLLGNGERVIIRSINTSVFDGARRLYMQ